MDFQGSIFMHRYFYTNFDEIIVENVSTQALGNFTVLSKETDKTSFTKEETIYVW